MATASHKCRGNHTRLTEELGIDTQFEFGGTFLQAFEFLVIFLVAALPMAPEIPDGFPDGPEFGVVRMALKASFVGKGEHLVVDTGGVTDSEHIDATVYEFL